MINWFMRFSLHLRVAIILAPLLGILGFGLADLWVTKDLWATKDESAWAVENNNNVAMHQLELVGECVLGISGCLLGKDEISVMLRSTPATETELVRIDIGASGHIRGLKMSLVQDGKEEQLAAQRTRQTDHWFVEFPRDLLTQPSFTVRIAIAQTKRVYLAEFPARLN